MNRHTRSAHCGFSLIELLVVIGIITVLVGITIPVVGRARRSAARTQCASNLRQIVSACLIRAQGNGGFLPLAGRVVVPPGTGGPGSVPNALSDSQRKKYAYFRWSAPGPGEQVAPVQAALAGILTGRAMNTDNFGDLSADFHDYRDSFRVFLCPAASAEEQESFGSMIFLKVDAGDGYQSLFEAPSNYAANGGALGFHYAPRYARRRLGGQQSRIRSAAETVLFADARVPGTAAGSISGDPLWWEPQLDSAGPVTLADALAGNNQLTPGAAMLFDRQRHGGQINLAFADGHVESRRVENGDLSRAFLLHD